MDLSHTHSQQVISQSLLQSTQLSSTTQPPLSTHTTTSDSSRALGSTTRARAAQQTLAKDNDSSESSSRQTRSNYQPYPSKRTRDTKAKGRSREITEEQPTLRSHKKYVPLTHHTYYSPYSSHLLHPSSHRARRTTYPVTSSALTINEPIRDTKGKKRAVPETLSKIIIFPWVPLLVLPSVFVQPQPLTLRHHTTISIRDVEKFEVMCQFGIPRACLNACLSIVQTSTTTKGKAAAAKSKAMAAPGPSHVEDEDTEMMHVEYKHEASDHDDQLDLAHDDRDGVEDEDGNENTGGRPPSNGASEEDGGGIPNGVGGLPHGFAGLDEGAAMAIFADY
jgi:E3 ubiquitin-protein ligase TRIP12